MMLTLLGLLSSRNTKASKVRCWILGLAYLCAVPAAQAAWVEASGQAVIESNNKQIARQRATQEAIKQALLFAGASVNSVQQMANGLLKDDRFEIRSSGEVQHIELVSETYHDDYVTVTIRADIFSQASSCENADYKKQITTAWFPIKHKQQATTGAIHNFGKSLTKQLEAEVNQHSINAYFNKVESYYLDLQQDSRSLIALANKNYSQYILLGEILDISFEENTTSPLKFWRDHADTRQLSLRISLYDATTGEKVLDDTFSTKSSWTFDTFSEIDVTSQVFWQSDYGQNALSLLQNINQRLDEALDCMPVYGKVLQVANNQLRINLGKQHGAKVGDHLTLFQMQHFFDQFGQAYEQYQIHPVAVEVRQVFPMTAVVAPVDGLPLGNIQTNDFVARR